MDSKELRYTPYLSLMIGIFFGAVGLAGLFFYFSFILVEIGMDYNSKMPWLPLVLYFSLTSEAIGIYFFVIGKRAIINWNSNSMLLKRSLIIFGIVTTLLLLFGLVN